MALETINRHLANLRADLAFEPSFPTVVEGPFPEAQLSNALKRFLIRKHVPFLAPDHEGDLLLSFKNINADQKRRVAYGLWADAARMPRGSRFDVIYGALLRQAQGHLVHGDKDYLRLEELLAADLAAGYRVVRLNGKLFVRSEGRWRPARSSLPSGAEAIWDRGVIISRNFGRVIVPPHLRDGVMVPGYTRNGHGEGPALVRDEPMEMLCAERELDGTNLAWVHAIIDREAA